MPNVHMQTAAHNLQRAISDIQLKQQQLRNQREDNKRESNSRINAMRTEEVRLRAESLNSNDDATRIVITGRINNLRQDISKAEQEIVQTDRNLLTEIEELDRQAQEIKEVSSRLEMMA